ncbi:hypothetical protein [Achromobacter dolens]|uniref:hypothetical protein n=1 Tax=Achromobacter dolens TaxID=1287738 RepID=UPI0031D53B0E
MLGKIGSVKNSQSGLFDMATFGAPGLATRRALPNSAILQASGESGGRPGRAAKWLGISAWHFGLAFRLGISRIGYRDARHGNCWPARSCRRWRARQALRQ